MSPASISGPVKQILRFITQALCLLLIALAAIVALFASFLAIALIIAWNKEGRLQVDDQGLLVKAVVGLAGSCMVVYIGWRLHCRARGRRCDDSFKLARSISGRSDELGQAAFTAIFFIVSAIWIWWLIPGRVLIKLPTLLGWLLVGFVGMHARIFLHELGHLFAAEFLGFYLRKIQVGHGRLLWSHRRKDGLLCEWRLSPRAGFVLATYPHKENWRARYAVFIAAGPAVDALVLWSMYQVIVGSFGGLAAAFLHNAGGMMLTALFYWTAMSAVSGLLPHSTRVGYKKVWTDGYWLYRVWKSSNPLFVELFDQDWTSALKLLESEYSDDGVSSRVVDLEPNHDRCTFEQQRERLASRLLPER